MDVDGCKSRHFPPGRRRCTIAVEKMHEMILLILPLHFRTWHQASSQQYCISFLDLALLAISADRNTSKIGRGDLIGGTTRLILEGHAR